MNRTAALFFAVGTFLAHCLAIHEDADGLFGAAHELAHAAFRGARNLVHNTSLRWNPALPATESYPSTLWILVCSIAEMLFVPVTLFAQTLGVVFAMLTIVVLAQINRGRLAGLVGSLLLVTNGALASAAIGGTELSLLALLLISAYLLYERRAAKALGPVLLLLCATRYEGVLFTLALLAIELVRRSRPGANTHLKPVMRAFAWPAVGAVLAAVSRQVLYGTPFSPSARALTDTSTWNPALGVDYLASFAFTLGAPLLVAIPILAWITGRRGEHGARPMILAAVLTLPVVLIGGDNQPFWAALVPMLPFLALSIQEAIELIVNSRRRFITSVSLGLLAFGLLASILSSKLPGNIGPLRTRTIQAAWLSPPESLRDAYGVPLARLGKAQQIQDTERLRCTGLFLRDQTGPGTTLLTPWPGAVGYLSGITVFDLLGRATPPAGQSFPNAWFGRTRVDLLREFERLPDLILASVNRPSPTSTIYRVLGRWIDSYDSVAKSPERSADILEFLRDHYELIAIPVPKRSDEPKSNSRIPVHMLRRRDLEQSPKLNVTVREGRLAVAVQHTGPHQLADLRVRITDSARQQWFLRPNGDCVRQSGVRARRELLLYSTGQRDVQLLDAKLPEEIDAATLEVVLLSPGADNGRLAEACEPVVVEL